MIDPRHTKAARRGLRRLMEHLGISAYLFALDQPEGGAQGRLTLTLEYAICSGWYTGSVELERADLERCDGDPEALARLATQLRATLPSCPPA